MAVVSPFLDIGWMYLSTSQDARRTTLSGATLLGPSGSAQYLCCGAKHRVVLLPVGNFNFGSQRQQPWASVSWNSPKHAGAWSGSRCAHLRRKQNGGWSHNYAGTTCFAVIDGGWCSDSVCRRCWSRDRHCAGRCNDRWVCLLAHYVPSPTSAGVADGSKIPISRLRVDVSVHVL